MLHRRFNIGFSTIVFLIESATCEYSVGYPQSSSCQTDTAIQIKVTNKPQVSSMPKHKVSYLATGKLVRDHFVLFKATDIMSSNIFLIRST